MSRSWFAMHWQLPRSTEGEDLVEVFGITRHVELAETPFGGARSKGYSVAQFSQAREAWTTIAKYEATWRVVVPGTCVSTIVGGTSCHWLPRVDKSCRHRWIVDGG